MLIFNIMEWRVTHVENFLSEIATFSQLWAYLNVTQAKQIITS